MSAEKKVHSKLKNIYEVVNVGFNTNFNYILVHYFLV